MRTAVCVAIIVLAGTAGELAVTHAMKQIGEVRAFSPAAVLRVIARAVRLPSTQIGIVLLTLSFFSLLALLSWAPVSFVVPATASSYAVGAAGAAVFLGERVTLERWAGVLLICAGVSLVWVG